MVEVEVKVGAAAEVEVEAEVKVGPSNLPRLADVNDIKPQPHYKAVKYSSITRRYQQ